MLSLVGTFKRKVFLTTPDDSQALNGLNILVVDDSADNQFLIGRLLKKRGATVDVADNGNEGVSKALAGEYSIVLMDLQMPEMDGYEATTKLRSSGYAKPVIALTAHALPEVKAQCLAAGYSDYVVKPIDTQTLIEKIQTWSAK